MQPPICDGLPFPMPAAAIIDVNDNKSESVIEDATDKISQYILLCQACKKDSKEKESFKVVDPEYECTEGDKMEQMQTSQPSAALVQTYS